MRLPASPDATATTINCTAEMGGAAFKRCKLEHAAHRANLAPQEHAEHKLEAKHLAASEPQPWKFPGSLRPTWPEILRKAANNWLNRGNRARHCALPWRPQSLCQAPKRALQFSSITLTRESELGLPRFKVARASKYFLAPA